MDHGAPSPTEEIVVRRDFFIGLGVVSMHGLSDVFFEDS